MCQKVYCHYSQVDKEDSHSGTEELLYEGFGRAIHCFGNQPMLQTCNNTEIERQKRHYWRPVLRHNVHYKE